MVAIEINEPIHYDSNLYLKKFRNKTLKDYEKYKKQLYIYSIYVHDKYGVYPNYIEWNYTRSSDTFRLPFIEEEFETTKAWILEILKKIYRETLFYPIVNYVNCKMICDVEDDCEYNKLEEY